MSATCVSVIRLAKKGKPLSAHVGDLRLWGAISLKPDSSVILKLKSTLTFLILWHVFTFWFHEYYDTALPASCLFPYFHICFEWEAIELIPFICVEFLNVVISLKNASLLPVQSSGSKGGLTVKCNCEIFWQKKKKTFLATLCSCLFLVFCLLL